jgi:signal transduction histidine kinase
MNLQAITSNDQPPTMTYKSTRNLGPGVRMGTDTTNQVKEKIKLKIVKEQREQFAQSLVHEVRNPLTNINLAIKMLDSAIDDISLKPYLDIITRSSKRINDLINELLNFQHVFELKAERHSIHDLLDEVLKMNEDRIRLKSIVISKEYTVLDCRRVLNKAKMQLAFTNIIINAIDAMAHGKGELKLITRSIDGRYVLQIEDNGCGISEENLQNIFNPYYSNKPGGLGLGLATTYDILKANHVTVDVESKEGEGTRFTLLFDHIIST